MSRWGQRWGQRWGGSWGGGGGGGGDLRELPSGVADRVVEGAEAQRGDAVVGGEKVLFCRPGVKFGR